MTKTIIADAGHGLFTLGKEDPNGVKEWTYNQKVLKAFVAYLNEHYGGFRIVRTDDPTGRRDVPLTERTGTAIAQGGDVLVSFHHNALNGRWGTHGGVETFVMTPLSANPASLRLAKLVHPEVVKAMGLRDRGIKPMNLHMLRETKIPSILVEGGFMDSLTDIDALRDDAKLKAQGEAIARGVATYLGLPKKEDVPKIKVGTATMKLPTQSYASPDFSAPKVAIYNTGVARHIYQVRDGWYQMYSGDWIPSNYGKNFDFEPSIKDEPEKEVEEKPEVEGLVYRVVTGSFSDKKLAEKRVQELKDKGFESFIIPKDL